MYPEINLGPLTLQTFGLMFALAFLGAGALIWKRLEEIGRPVDWAYEMGFAALAGGVVGSRIYFIVQNYDSVKENLLANIFSGSGLVWYGGVIGGALAVLLWAWYRDFLGLALLDLAAPRPGPGRYRNRPRPVASSPVTATMARRGTGPGPCPTPTAPCQPTPRFTRPRSTRLWRWASGPGPSGSSATVSGLAFPLPPISSLRAPSAS